MLVCVTAVSVVLNMWYVAVTLAVSLSVCVGVVHGVHPFPIRTAYHLVGVECGENCNEPLVGYGVMYGLMCNGKDVCHLARKPLLHSQHGLHFLCACSN